MIWSRAGEGSRGGTNGLELGRLPEPSRACLRLAFPILAWSCSLGARTRPPSANRRAMGDTGQRVKLGVALCRDGAVAPKRATVGSAGYDLYAAVPTSIAAGGRGTVLTGVKLAIPAGHYGRVAPRSSLAANLCIDVAAGVVDGDFRGEVGVLLVNHGESGYSVNAGDRVAQLILEKISTPEIELVRELDETDRGAGGWGSTGVAD